MKIYDAAFPVGERTSVYQGDSAVKIETANYIKKAARPLEQF